MATRPEYQWNCDSNNALCAVDPLNPTNDIDIPTRMPRLRTPILQMYLGSVELPLAQLTVESLWNTLYFDQGVRLIVNSDSELCAREFTVISNGTDYITGIVPIVFNPIVSVDTSDATSPIFTTLFDHALDLRGQWNWGDPIQLVSTPLVDHAFIDLTADNTHLTILSPNTFQLSGVPSVTYQNPGGIYGYVHAPPIASPFYLSQIVNAALNVVAPGAFSVTYNLDTGRFQFQSLLTLDSTCTTDPPLSPTNLVISIPSQSCLAALMGFGVGNVPVPSPSSLVNCKPDETCKTYVLEGGFGYQCFSQINLLSANYSADTFASQLSLQWNRFFFDGNCNGSTAPVFVFSSSNGECSSFSIPFGLYTPDTFAEYLENGMNTNDILAHTYTVTYDLTTGRFCFQVNQVGETFGLEFGDTTTTFSPNVIGFDTINYRGQSQYCSTTSFTVPMGNCCGSSSLTRYSSWIFTPRVSLAQNKFQIQVNPPRFIVTGLLTDLGGGVAEIFTQAPNLRAHGLQPEDLVFVLDQGSGDQYYLRVIEVVDAFTLRADIGSVAAFIGATNQAVSFGLADAPVASLLFSDQNRPNALPPRYLGYGNVDALFTPGVPIPPFISPFSFDLSAPKYLLMVITEPNGSTHNNHAWKQSNIPNVFAKIILYPEWRLERNTLMNDFFPQVNTIDKVHFVFLNPDHTQYQFHGKNWSASITMVLAEAQLDSLGGCF
jgi:hypothetical protein